MRSAETVNRQEDRRETVKRRRRGLGQAARERVHTFREHEEDMERHRETEGTEYEVSPPSVGELVKSAPFELRQLVGTH